MTGAFYTRRCTDCRFSKSVPLPSLDKKVIYLDQFAISEFFRAKAGNLRGSEQSKRYWKQVYTAINKAHLLQQAIFPQSMIHANETAKFSLASDLTIAHEIIGGDVRFRHHHEIAREQVLAFAQAFIEGRGPPELAVDVDSILEGERNDWLPRPHITVDMDYGMFADQVRADQDRAAPEWAELYDRWKIEKPTFETALRNELQSYRWARLGAIRSAGKRAEEALRTNNPWNVFDARRHPAIREFDELTELFQKAGVPEETIGTKVIEFWEWSGLQQMPEHRISCYLFAAVARKLASGQKDYPTRGLANDISFISTYAPYIDAMFVDSECGTYLREGPLNSELRYKAKIFSPAKPQEFLDYLNGLIDATPKNVAAAAEELYSVSSIGDV